MLHGKYSTAWGGDAKKPWGKVKWCIYLKTNCIHTNKGGALYFLSSFLEQFYQVTAQTTAILGDHVWWSLIQKMGQLQINCQAVSNTCYILLFKGCCHFWRLETFLLKWIITKLALLCIIIDNILLMDWKRPY